MRIMLVGGGTGGHFYPLMAIADALKEEAEQVGRELELSYIGPDPYNAEMLEVRNIRFVRCLAGKLRRYSSVKNIFDVPKTVLGVLSALLKLYIIYPDAVMSKGSYTSVPVVLAARFLRIPVVIHESDVTPGRANRLAGRFARYIGISYPETTARFKNRDRVALVGIPLQKELLASLRPDEKKENTPLHLLILGGSQGSLRINELILESIEELTPYYELIHVTGPLHHQRTLAAGAALLSSSPYKDRYRAVGLLTQSEVGKALQDATLVISRAGSTSIFEIAASGTPAILIPIPEDVSHDQTKNAYTYARYGAASVIEEKNLTAHLLLSEVRRIVDNPALLKTMQNAARTFYIPHAAVTLARALIAIGIEHKS